VGEPQVSCLSDEMAGSGDGLRLMTAVECPLHALDAGAPGAEVLEFVRAVDPEAHEERGAGVLD
jgi:hypothetical protein